jgi:hypothetical protein
VAADSVPNAKGTGKTAKVTYAVGEAEGPIMMAELEFAEYKVPQQAFCKSHAVSVYQHYLIYS